MNGAALAIHAAYTLRLFYKSASLAPTGCADHGQRTSGSTPGRQVDDVLCVRLAKDQHQAHAVSSWAPLRARITVAIVRWSQCWTARYVRQLAGERLCRPQIIVTGDQTWLWTTLRREPGSICPWAPSDFRSDESPRYPDGAPRCRLGIGPALDGE